MPKWDVYDRKDHWTGEVIDGWWDLFKFVWGLPPWQVPGRHIYPFREWVRARRRRKLNEAETIHRQSEADDAVARQDVDGR